MDKQKKMGVTSTSTVSRRPFKSCPRCQVVWGTSTDFLKDVTLSCIGRQKGWKGGDFGLILFNHSCGTTLSIKAESQMLLKATGNSYE